MRRPGRIGGTCDQMVERRLSSSSPSRDDWTRYTGLPWTRLISSLQRSSLWPGIRPSTTARFRWDSLVGSQHHLSVAHEMHAPSHHLIQLYSTAASPSSSRGRGSGMLNARDQCPQPYSDDESTVTDSLLPRLSHSHAEIPFRSMAVAYST
nr:hypothetical protein CFP56_03120 [Quercus suber]